MKKTIKVSVKQHDKDGYYVATSNDMKELLVIGDNFLEVIEEVPKVIAMVERAKAARRKNRTQPVKRPVYQFRKVSSLELAAV